MANAQLGKQQLLELVYEALAEINLERLDENQLPRDPATVLYGANAALDSMDLVRLVILYEQKLNEVAGSELSLSDDRAMSEENSPFQTLGSLVDFAARLLKEEADSR